MILNNVIKTNVNKQKNTARNMIIHAGMQQKNIGNVFTMKIIWTVTFVTRLLKKIQVQMISQLIFVKIVLIAVLTHIENNLCFLTAGSHAMLNVVEWHMITLLTRLKQNLDLVFWISVAIFLHYVQKMKLYVMRFISNGKSVVLSKWLMTVANVPTPSR